MRLSKRFTSFAGISLCDISAIRKQTTFYRVLAWDLFRAKWNIFNSMSGHFLVAVYMIQPEVKLVAGVISLRSFWQKWNFVLGDKASWKHYPKWNHMKGNICTCVNKNDWLLLKGPFILGHPRNEIRFISPTMKSNANRIL